MYCSTPTIFFATTPRNDKPCVHIRTPERRVVLVAHADEADHLDMLPRVRRTAHRLAHGLPLA